MKKLITTLLMLLSFILGGTLVNYSAQLTELYSSVANATDVNATDVNATDVNATVE